MKNVFFSVLFLMVFLRVGTTKMSSIESMKESEKTNFQMNKEERTGLKLKAREMFNFAYHSYMDFAFPADELQPLECKGRYRNNSDRGTLDEALGE